VGLAYRLDKYKTHRAGLVNRPEFNLASGRAPAKKAKGKKVKEKEQKIARE
jgi:hypothetical protein